LPKKHFDLAAYWRAERGKIRLPSPPKLTKQTIEITREIGPRAADGERANITQTCSAAPGGGGNSQRAAEAVYRQATLPRRHFPAVIPSARLQGKTQLQRAA
jgi:hypothetical protein